MLGNILIDTIRINMPVSEPPTKGTTLFLRKVLSKYFSDKAFHISVSRNELKITLTPTRFIPISTDYYFTDVNLEMPSEDRLFNLLNELGCYKSENRMLINNCRIVKLHLTKNLITKEPVYEYVDSLSKRTYKRMKANVIQSNETNRTLSIATPKRDRKVKNTKGDRQFVLYDKSQQLKNRAGFKYVILKTPLSKEEIQLVSLKNYNEETGFLKISELNFARFELQYATSSKLNKLSKFITRRKNDTKLNLRTLLNLLQERKLFSTLEQFYTNELREYIFFDTPLVEIEPATRWNGIFQELINEADVKSMIALYAECTTDSINNKGNFITAVKKAQKVSSDKLYAELYRKLGIAETPAITA